MEQDKKQLVLKAIKKYSDKNFIAADLGCGIGHFTPHLAPLFKHVHAMDLSKKCITKAKEKCSGLDNIEFKTCDLSNTRIKIPKVDFVLCVNAIITSSLMVRINMHNVICKTLKAGAHLVLVVPSLESALLTDSRLIEWDIKTKKKISQRKASDNTRLHEGVVKIDNVSTKHYLKEELDALLQARGMKVLETKKINYPWETEFEAPPKWMQEPYPWDWLCIAEKIE